MNTTSLYRALIEAGTSEETAKEAADQISDKIDTLEIEKISQLEKDVAELKIMTRINTAMLVALIIKSFFL